MTPKNNLNILPIYETLTEQNARQWWVYGKIYPLFSPLNYLPPFQIKRDHMPEQQEPDEVYSGSEIDETGNVVNGTGDVWMFEVSEGDVIDVSNMVGEGLAVDRLSLAMLDDDDILLFSFRETLTPNYIRGIIIPANVTKIYVQVTYNTLVFFEDGDGVADLYYDLLTADGEVVETRQILGVTTKTEDGYDYLINNQIELSGHSEGQYFMRLYDGANTWYTDVFTWVADHRKLLQLSWHDYQDFVLDNGDNKIIYNLGDEGYYWNVLYLKAEIAKPTYPFEEEVENRDGYLFPIKMISSKQYHFHFLAPEYLLDVLRLVRMSDDVEIECWIFDESGQTAGSNIFFPDSILFTPEWEAEGDLAAVSVEFQTDTIAKKINFVQ